MARSRLSTHSACLSRQDCRAAFSSQELKSTSGTADEQSGGQERQLTSRGTLVEGATDAGCLERQAPAAGPTLITGPAPSARAVPEPAPTSSSLSPDHRRKHNANSYSGREGIWKLSCCMGQSFRCEAAHHEIDPRLNGGRQPLTVLGQAPVAHEPCAGRRHSPALRQNRKPGRHFRAAQSIGTSLRRRCPTRGSPLIVAPPPGEVSPPPERPRLCCATCRPSS